VKTAAEATSHRLAASAIVNPEATCGFGFSRSAPKSAEVAGLRASRGEAMARPPDGLKHVDRLSGPETVKHRLRVILETLSGERSVAEACEELGVSEARFHTLRRQALEGALSSLKPARAGRPRKPSPAGPSKIEQLEQELDEVRMQLWAAEIREEIALTMPHLLRKGKKKKKAEMPRSGKRRRSRG
jgi:transposase-like protein